MQSYNWIGGVFLPESEFPIGGDYQICASSIVTILSIAIVITLMVSFTATLTSIPSYAAKPPGKGATITHGTCDILSQRPWFFLHPMIAATSLERNYLSMVV